MKPIHQILGTPILTEKSSTYLYNEKTDTYKYTFKVGRDSNKFEIKSAIEKRFEVAVASVNTVIVRGKVKRVRAKAGKRANYKKAIVTLKAGNKISEFEGA